MHSLFFHFCINFFQGGNAAPITLTTMSPDNFMLFQHANVSKGKGACGGAGGHGGRGGSGGSGGHGNDSFFISIFIFYSKAHYSFLFD